jgi:hypothetical protein
MIEKVKIKIVVRRSLSVYYVAYRFGIWNTVVDMIHVLNFQGWGITPFDGIETLE